VDGLTKVGHRFHANQKKDHQNPNILEVNRGKRNPKTRAKRGKKKGFSSTRGKENENLYGKKFSYCGGLNQRKGKQRNKKKTDKTQRAKEISRNFRKKTLKKKTNTDAFAVQRFPLKGGGENEEETYRQAQKRRAENPFGGRASLEGAPQTKLGGGT